MYVTSLLNHVSRVVEIVECENTLFLRIHQTFLSIKAINVEASQSIKVRQISNREQFIRDNIFYKTLKANVSRRSRGHQPCPHHCSPQCPCNATKSKTVIDGITGLIFAVCQGFKNRDRENIWIRNAFNQRGSKSRKVLRIGSERLHTGDREQPGSLSPLLALERNTSRKFSKNN